jgi:small subunit ribosomal protein S5
MSEEKIQSGTEEKKTPAARGPRGGGERGPKGERGERKGPRRDKKEGADSRWSDKVIQVSRVTKVVKGGKKMSFRALIAVGDGNGTIGIGIGKANEVQNAVAKGIADAKKNLVTVPLSKGTIPYLVEGRDGAGKVLLRPASEGTGVIAGGAVRPILELVGIKNILAKSLGSSNPLANSRATIAALSSLRTPDEILIARGKKSAATAAKE